MSVLMAMKAGISMQYITNNTTLTVQVCKKPLMASGKIQGGQTNILRNRGGRTLQLKYVKLKLAKARGGGGGGGH